MPTTGKNIQQKGLTSKNHRGISGSQIDRIVSHPFYYGYIEDIDEDDNKILRPHKYETLINKELYDMCQDVKKQR
ncbi:MAG: recombinase family protein [Alphaproteobacteria bacterium]|nr:recombinase family protein [Rickettsiales bacterium]